MQLQNIKTGVNPNTFAIEVSGEFTATVEQIMDAGAWDGTQQLALDLGAHILDQLAEFAKNK